MSLIQMFTSTAQDVAEVLPLDVVAQTRETCTSNGESITGVLCREGGQVEALLKALIFVIAVVFVIYKAVSSKFALGTIVVSALVAGLLVWIVYNTEALFGWIGGEVKAVDAPAPPAVVDVVDSVPGELLA